VLGADVDLDPANGLAVGLRLVGVAEDAADHERAGDLGAHRIDGLDLQTGPDQVLGQLPAAQAGGQVDVFGQPSQRRPHLAAPFSDRLKRTSPSTMSRMSAALFRNIRVRSMPMPKANPE